MIIGELSPLRIMLKRQMMTRKETESENYQCLIQIPKSYISSTSFSHQLEPR
jgi:hypothetical protein